MDELQQRRDEAVAAAREAEAAYLQRLYDEAGSVSALARYLGKSTTTVRYHLEKHGIPIRGKGFKSPKAVTHRGSANQNWRGGTYRHTDGYIYAYAPDHPAAVKRYVLQHRLVMEASLGRYLDRGEDVHHRNGDKADNRLENLELVLRSVHMSRHKRDAPRDAGGRFA